MSALARERLLLGLTVVGFVVPNAMVVLFVVRHGVDARLYFTQWVEMLPAAQLTADLGLSCLAFLGWTAWDGPRSGVRRWWVGLPATALVGLCLAVPLYLLLRERAGPHPATCAGRSDPPESVSQATRNSARRGPTISGAST